MRRIRVLSTIEHLMQAQLIRHYLDACEDIEMVAESIDPIEVMALVAQIKPDVWIHSWEEGPQLQATLSHLYALNPALTVVRVNPQESAGYVQVQVSSLDSLAAILHSTVRDQDFHQVS